MKTIVTALIAATVTSSVAMAGKPPKGQCPPVNACYQPCVSPETPPTKAKGNNGFGNGGNDGVPGNSGNNGSPNAAQKKADIVR